MARKKTAPHAAAAIDTAAGSSAYALAIQHRPQIELRLPTGTMAELAADLGTLGVPPAPVPPTSPSSQSRPLPPSLPVALATAANLISAIHDALHAAKVKPAIRKAYGVSKASPAKEPMAVLEAAEKIIAEANSNPTEALSVGIVPADVTAIQQALADLAVAVTAAHAHGGKTTPTAKDRGVAAKRMHEATGRISGAGVLAFATNATVRAEFAALKPMKNVS